MTQEALKLALEALEAFNSEFVCQATHHKRKNQHSYFSPCPNVAKYDEAIIAIKEALAQPTSSDYALGYSIGFGEGHSAGKALAQHDSVQAKPEPEQEPVKWSDYELDGVHHNKPEPVGQLLEDAFGRGQVMWFNKPKDESMLYTTPPQRKPMTDEEIDFHLDKILRASGTALKNYSMQKTKDDMRQALREAFV